jgi:hypothetical protein
MIRFSSVSLSDHARSAMARREIAAASMREVPRAPQAVVPGNRPSRQVAQGPVMLGDPPRRVLLRVVVDVDKVPPEVVTVYATSQFGRYGAEPSRSATMLQPIR